MKSLFVTLVSALLLSTVVATAARAEDVPLDTESLRRTIARSLRWLEDDMVKWRTDQRCAACHHGPMYLWTMHAARRKGYSVDEARLREMTDWLLKSDDSRIFPKPAVKAADLAASSDAADRMAGAMMGKNQLSQPTLFLAHALNAMPKDDPAKALGWRRILEHWQTAQNEDGSFAGRRGAPPIFNTPQILTLVAATALGDADREAAFPDARLAASAARARTRAETFLAAQPPNASHQGQVLQLLRQAPQDRRSEIPVAPHSIDDARSYEPIVEELRKLQRSDGGWSQTADRASDAFATGQTLYVLGRAGIRLEDPAVRRAIEFLRRTQRADGTWEMTSRPDPESGEPATLRNPITYAGTAWATLGLLTHAPAASP